MPLRLAFCVSSICSAQHSTGSAVPLLSPRLGGDMLGLAGFQPGPDYRYAIGMTAALMAGWTLLLAGVIDPISRRATLLLTAVPVVAGLFAAGAHAVAAGLVALPFMAPIFVFQALGFALFVVGYRVAGGWAASGERAN